MPAVIESAFNAFNAFNALRLTWGPVATDWDV